MRDVDDNELVTDMGIEDPIDSDEYVDSDVEDGMYDDDPSPYDGNCCDVDLEDDDRYYPDEEF
jgi:hypothetical protein